MAKITWDDTGKRLYETGTDHAVLYVQKTDGTYDKGVAWNGITAVTESPSGAEANDIYADNIKYASLRSAEDFGATIEAYTYPDEFMVCDGTADIQDSDGKSIGLYVGQQTRRAFGFTYRTLLGNDVQLTDYGYKLHIIYNATASPSEKNYQTVNDSPEALSFSWEVTTTPINMTGQKPTAQLIVDSTKAKAEYLKVLEDMLYGAETAEPTLPTPDVVAKILSTGSAE